ncbi:hypothetical protein [Aureispira sp. CCB-QB1]|uniref:hypothetical protein n=1 Tax=Aureispira sp. CCB-QB1 TaxID=1313421 RepID=UPI0006987CD5|nr:hypothetical protein [Aureispira sp. CCB-QB1]
MMQNENNTPENTPEVIAKKISDLDPLADNETNTESDFETNLEDSENNSGKNLEDSENNSGKNLETVEKPLETDLEEIEEEDGKVLEEYENGENGNSGTAFQGEKVTKVESTEDPLGDEPDPEPEEPEEPEVSDEFRLWLSKMAVDGINYLDEIKAQICVAFGGGYASDYATNSFVKKSLITSAKELANQKDLKPPSPMQVFLMSLAAMTAPPILLVLFRRHIKPAPQNVNREKAEADDIPEAVTDYTNTAEYQEGRKQFKVHPSGAYMYGLGGRNDYKSAGVADCYPSPEVQKLINEGKTSSEIKKIIYG